MVFAVEMCSNLPFLLRLEPFMGGATSSILFVAEHVESHLSFQNKL